MRQEIISHRDFWDRNKKILDETEDEFQERINHINQLCDYDVDEKCQDGYYLDEENIKKDMLKGFIPFDREWYEDYLKRTSAQ